MAIPSCCLKTFEWNGTPTGRVDRLAENDTYITGNNSDRAVLLIADLLGWSFPNSRLLADHYAREADATVYLPDFFGGEILPFEPLCKGRFEEIDLQGYLTRNSRAVREPEIFDCARALRKKYKKVAAVGFCYGGWAVFRLGAKEHQPPMVDCITAGHASLLTKDDIDSASVPVQILAPEHDEMYTPEMKMHSFVTLQKNGVTFDYQHFPGVEHACFTRGDDENQGEREALVRGKDAAVSWMKFWLRE